MCKKGRGMRTVPSLRGKSLGIIRGLSVGIMTENYHLLYQSRRKVEIYRDTGVSKNQSQLDDLIFSKLCFPIKT